MLLIFKSGDASSSTAVAQNDAGKVEKTEDTAKERPSKKNKKKEKEIVDKPSLKTKIEKRLLVLPLEASIFGILLLVLLGAFYVVCGLYLF